MARVPEGVFWADHIRTLRESPPARLVCALEHLPLPAAYREAAIALRALIRNKRKQADDWESELATLYNLAAEASFMLDTPYIEGIGPGYNVACSISIETRASLTYPYSEVGYKNVALLNKTDCKWLVEAWGEPFHHRCPQDFHRDVWDDAVSKCMNHKGAREEEARRGTIRHLAGARTAPAFAGHRRQGSVLVDHTHKRTGLRARLVCLTILLASLFFFLHSYLA